MRNGIAESIVGASSLEEVSRLQAKNGALVQLDDNVTPTMFHCATVSYLEIDALKQIKSVIRKGHDTRVTPEEVTLVDGSYVPEPDTLYIDCSASAIPRLPPVTIFRGQNITIQPVRHCQQTFSAALIAHVEATYEDDDFKNSLCRPVAMPHKPSDYPVLMLQSNTNLLNWYKQPKTMAWFSKCRLNIMKEMVPPAPEDPQQRAAYYQQLLGTMEAGNQKIKSLIQKLPEQEQAKIKAFL
jgi:hypothetical protein